MGRYSSFRAIETNITFTVLHPCHKLTYFKNMGWNKEWITAAKDIVEAEFLRSYAVADVESPAPLVVDKVSECIIRLD